MESLIIDYIDNRLNDVDRKRVEHELNSNAEARRLFDELTELMKLMDDVSVLEPPVKANLNFNDALKRERSHHSHRLLFAPALYRVAAAVTLLILGAGIGYWITRHYDNREELAAIRLEMQQTKALMMKMLDNDQSASQRIRGVNVANTMNEADDEIVSALVNAMNNDPNSNVRLAALDALGKLSDDGKVRTALVRSLPKQNDPVVQIALIQLLVKMKEKAVVKDLQRIVDDSETMKAVKDEAYSGILKLS